MTQKEKALLLLSRIMDASVLRDRGDGIIEIELDTVRLGNSSIIEIKRSFTLIESAMKQHETVEEWANSFIGKEIKEGGSKIRNYVGKGIIENWELGAKGTGIHFKFKDENGEEHSVWRPLPRKFLEEKNGK